MKGKFLSQLAHYFVKINYDTFVPTYYKLSFYFSACWPFFLACCFVFCFSSILFLHFSGAFLFLLSAQYNFGEDYFLKSLGWIIRVFFLNSCSNLQLTSSLCLFPLDYFLYLYFPHEKHLFNVQFIALHSFGY